MFQRRTRALLVSLFLPAAALAAPPTQTARMLPAELDLGVFLDMPLIRAKLPEALSDGPIAGVLGNLAKLIRVDLREEAEATEIVLGSLLKREEMSRFVVALARSGGAPHPAKRAAAAAVATGEVSASDSAYHGTTLYGLVTQDGLMLHQSADLADDRRHLFSHDQAGAHLFAKAILDTAAGQAPSFQDRTQPQGNEYLDGMSFLAGRADRTPDVTAFFDAVGAPALKAVSHLEARVAIEPEAPTLVLFLGQLACDPGTTEPVYQAIQDRLKSLEQQVAPGHPLRPFVENAEAGISGDTVEVSTRVEAEYLRNLLAGRQDASNSD